MYLRFYGLREKPFNPTPDPRFLYLSREAMAQLEYGVRERRGFLLLTGEVGTGKTTLLRALLERLDEETASRTPERLRRVASRWFSPARSWRSRRMAPQSMTISIARLRGVAKEAFGRLCTASRALRRSTSGS